MTPPPVCENCKRVVFSTTRVALFRDGSIMVEADLCSACRVHVTDCFGQPATWLSLYETGRA